MPKPLVPGRRVPLVATLAVACLMLAWVFGNPPGAAPDEKGHYIKAVGLGNGELLGRAPPIPTATTITREQYEELAKLLKQRGTGDETTHFSETKAGRWQQESAREFSVPAGLGYNRLGCDLTVPERSARCLEEGRASTSREWVKSSMGTYQPYLYVLPAAAVRAGNNPLDALRLGRTAVALLSLGLLATACMLLWEGSRGALSLTGLLVALSPSVLFFGSTLSTSGPEICAAVCFTAGLIRLTRHPLAPRWAWGATGAAGTVLALSRSWGPIFIVVALLAALAFTDIRRVRGVLSRGRRPALLASALIAAGIVAGVAWQVRYQPNLGWDSRVIRAQIDPSIDSLGELSKQVVAKFGALETDVPLWAYVGWWALFAVLAGVALGVARVRERVALVGLALGVLILVVGLSAVYGQTGFPLQGRHVLPLAVLVPLWAGELVRRSAHRLAPANARRLLIGFGVVAAVVHVGAWYANARRFAVGEEGDWGFIGQAEWSPPVGWGVWLTVLLAGAVLLLVSGAGGARTLDAAHSTDR